MLLSFSPVSSRDVCRWKNMTNGSFTTRPSTWQTDLFCFFLVAITHPSSVSAIITRLLSSLLGQTLCSSDVLPLCGWKFIFQELFRLRWNSRVHGTDSPSGAPYRGPVICRCGAQLLLRHPFPWYAEADPGFPTHSASRIFILSHILLT